MQDSPAVHSGARFSPLEEKAISLLGSGYAQSVVATAIGCSPSLVSDLLKKEEFAVAVAQMRLKELTDLKQKDNNIEGIERSLLEKLENLVPHLNKPHDVLRALQTVNLLKRRSEALIAPAAQTQNVQRNITLVLPVKVVREFTLNNKNEVTSVEGRSLRGMDTLELMKQITPVTEKEINSDGNIDQHAARELLKEVAADFQIEDIEFTNPTLPERKDRIYESGGKTAFVTADSI